MQGGSSMKRLAALVLPLALLAAVIACEQQQEEAATGTPSPAVTATATSQATPSGEATWTPEAAATPEPTSTPEETVTLEETPTPGPSSTPPPAPEGPELGTWRGTTSQGKPIEFDVIEGSRALGRIEFYFVGTSAAGQPCEGRRGEEHTGVPIVDNEFSLDRMKYGDFQISGRFDSATTASGDLEYYSFALPPDYDPCGAGHMTWTASPQ